MLKNNVLVYPEASRAESASASTPSPHTLLRILRYIGLKGAGIALTVVIGLYLTILIANLGGYVDEMYKGVIFESLLNARHGGWLADETPEEQERIFYETLWQLEEARGLHQPFMLRSFRILQSSLLLDFGASRQEILQALPNTVALVGLTNLLVFLLSISLALVLSRSPGSLVDRLTAFLSPLTFAPAWVHALVIISILITLLLQPVISKYLILIMVTSIFLSVFFRGAYTWRSFFQNFRNEDYVELAKAKGLPKSRIDRHYVLRPLLPYVVTDFAILALSLWQEAIPLEVLLGWPGIGLLFIYSIQDLNTITPVGIVVIFAYMLAITLFLLDILYALLDPRVRVGGESKTLRLLADKPNLKGVKRLFSRKVEPAPLGIEPAAIQARPLKFPHPQPIGFLTGLGRGLRDSLLSLKSFLGELLRYPSGVFGLVGLLVLTAITGYTLAFVPMEKAIMYWRGQSENRYQNAWYRNPVNVPPAWVNWFRQDKLPPTLIFNTADEKFQKEVSVLSEEMTQVVVPFTFQYDYDGFPSQITLYFDVKYEKKIPLVMLTWLTPDRQEIELGSMSVRPHMNYYLSSDPKLSRKLGGQNPTVGLFSPLALKSGKEAAGQPQPWKGTYQLEVKTFLFEPGSSVDVEAIFYGQVHGLAGTDPSRRDPMLALLWGTTIALAFGLFGAVGTSLAAMTLAAVGVWYHGWVDSLIQRLTEINLVLPKLLIVILIYILYTKSIWVILAVLVVLNIFGSPLKSFRAVFMQVKESPYIESALCYGASSRRIIARYLAPRVLPVLVPQMVMLVPGYVFYEATLAFLSVRDPYLPTWGKLLYEALMSDALIKGYWHQFIVPIALLSLTGLVFSSLGYTLERMMNKAFTQA
ncbi:MAG: ABC transporter permease subunit [Chloroflexi bacterium]|nr:MAG: ABC transporter permease subunit [Chloroflexota bacterium]